jgi:N-acetylmuramoyl-L-alanine amidase
MWLKITNNYSPNFNIKKRSKKTIKFIILHYTGMKKESQAIKRLCDHKSKVSAHYFIKKNGSVQNLVPDLYVSWHAGISSWKKLKSLNEYSIGIEIQNSGHSFLKNLVKSYRIDYRNILGHSDISPDRKKDPGEKFPWKRLSKIRLAQWHSLDEKKLRISRSIKINLKEEHEFLKNLNKVGYSKIKNKKILALAFQRRFRQKLINGLIDKECLLISRNLAKQS